MENFIVVIIIILHVFGIIKAFLFSFFLHKYISYIRYLRGLIEILKAH